MKKISLNDIDKSRNNDNGEYQLDPTEKYVINLEEELQFQTAIMTSFQIMGAPPALKNYHAWLFKNNFSYEMPNPTNEVVAPYYGVGPLWKTEYSQGIVVRAEDDDDYYIVMECSSKNKGSAKRTAASQMKMLVDEGKIEKIQSTSKAHQATVYKKCGGK